MKKTFKAVLTFSFVLYAVSCSEPELKNSENFENSTEDDGTTTTTTTMSQDDWVAFGNRVTDVTRHNYVQYGEYIGTIRYCDTPPRYAYLNPWKEIVYNTENFPDNPGDFPHQEWASQMVFAVEPNPYAPGTKTYHQMLDTDFAEFGQLLTFIQKDILNDYFTEMESVTSASGATQKYDNAILAINTSGLGEENARYTRMWVEIGHGVAVEYFSNHQHVINHLENEVQGPETRFQEFQACPGINWRDVWRAAVWGAFGGAARGAFVGAGTVVVVAGIAVTGPLGAAVLLGAAGYAAGAAGAVAYQWFWNCMMQSPISNPDDLRCEDPVFALANQEYCNIDREAVDIRWFLTGQDCP